MKQFNVRDVTHVLGKLLSLQTGKSVLDVVHEALEMYQRNFENNEQESEILQRAVAVIDERMCQVVHEEVAHAMDELSRLQEEVREQRAKELEQLLRETTPEAPEDDLEVVQYKEAYRGDNGNDSDAQD